MDEDAAEAPAFSDGGVRSNAFLEDNRGSQFPRAVNPSLDAFMSAQSKDTGAFGVGASGILYYPGTIRAQANYAFDVTNVGAGVDRLRGTFKIPAIRWDTPSTGATT